jgi:hypothetical protein
MLFEPIWFYLCVGKGTKGRHVERIDVPRCFESCWQCLMIFLSPSTRPACWECLHLPWEQIALFPGVAEVLFFFQMSWYSCQSGGYHILFASWCPSFRRWLLNYKRWQKMVCRLRVFLSQVQTWTNFIALPRAFPVESVDIGLESMSSANSGRIGFSNSLATGRTWGPRKEEAEAHNGGAKRSLNRTVQMNRPHWLKNGATCAMLRGWVHCLL